MSKRDRLFRTRASRMMITRPLKNSFSLSPLHPEDAIAYVKHLNDPQIHETTENIPYPYTQEHADYWINRQMAIARHYGKPHLLAIRNPQADLIGTIGIGEMDKKHPYVAELGYWLASPYWGKGIMTEAVWVFVHYAFTELDLLRLWTRVFEFNIGSRRVLEKNNFQLEGIQRQHVYQNGKWIDDYLYGLLKDEFH
jgi:RimJ/RimL family protein N-acetyltransferase